MDIYRWMVEQEQDLLYLMEQAYRKKKMSIFESRPLTVKQVTEQWTIQAANNPLYSDEEKAAITATIQIIQDKKKQDALQALQKQINSHDGMSLEACFARIFSRKLKYGE